MAKQTGASTSKPSLRARVQGFLQEVKNELTKVTWPSKEELKSSTQVVLILLVLFAAIIYVYDIVFQRIVVWLLYVAT